MSDRNTVKAGASFVVLAVLAATFTGTAAAHPADDRHAAADEGMMHMMDGNGDQCMKMMQMMPEPGMKNHMDACMKMMDDMSEDEMQDYMAMCMNMMQMMR